MNKENKWQVTGRVASNLIVVFAGVAFYMALSNFDALRAQLRAWLGILSPFVWGLVIAYLLDAPVRFFESKLGGRRKLSILISYVLAFLVVGFLLRMVLPQIGDSLFLLAGRIPSFLVNTIICLIATVFIAVDFDGIRRFILCNLPEKPLQMVIDVKDTFLDIIWQFIRSYFVIFLITATELTAGLWIIGMESPLFFGAVIAIFDAFPIVGSGMFLLPWGVFKLVAGKLWQGVGLVALYLVITVVRQIIEPKIVGKHVGLRPIVTLVCMYAGTKLFGGIGLLALPVMVAILTDMNDRGLIHLFRHPEKEEDASVGEEIV